MQSSENNFLISFTFACVDVDDEEGASSDDADSFSSLSTACKADNNKAIVSTIHLQRFTRLSFDSESISSKFFALQSALYLPTFVLVLAGACYLIATFYVEEDRLEALFQMDCKFGNLISKPEKFFFSCGQLDASERYRGYGCVDSS